MSPEHARRRLRLVALANAVTLVAGLAALAVHDDGTRKATTVAAPPTAVAATVPPPTAPPVTEAPPVPGPCSGNAPAPFGGPTNTVAQANGSGVTIFSAPGGQSVRTLPNPQAEGAPLVLLVQEDRGDWLKVLLPIRPNGTSGWVQRGQVNVTQHPWRLIIELANHCITTYRGTDTFLREPVGVGTGNTPTPGGLYYLTVLFQPPNPGGAYGPYAYQLSGFSEVLLSFEGGAGNLGIHGTNNPDAVGTDVSHGCIRMNNDGISKLATTLPLGVPVEIRA